MATKTRDEADGAGEGSVTAANRGPESTEPARDGGSSSAGAARQSGPENAFQAASSPTEKQDAALAALEEGNADKIRQGAAELLTDEDRERYVRETVAIPGQPVVREADGTEWGFTGQVPAQPDNEAYTVAGVTSGDEAARADRAASNPRLFRDVPAHGAE
jgi:hypothetical protein